MSFTARVVVATVAALALPAAPALAKCTKLAFSVNDYGKDGPAKDAKALLDKYIADWAAKRGIAKYTTGKKDVTCELFLDFKIFDEYTCKAAATVCWGEAPAAKADEAAAAPAAGAATATAPVVRKAPIVKARAAKQDPAAAGQPKAKQDAAPVKAPPPAKKKADQPA